MTRRSQTITVHAGIDPGYHRRLGLDPFVHSTEGTIAPVMYTMDGLTQNGAPWLPALWSSRRERTRAS